MNSNRRPTTEPFSSGYELVHGAEVHTYGDDEAIMDFEMFEALEQQFGAPLIARIGNLHYHMKPEQAIMPLTVAVPEHNHDDPDTLLIQK